MRAIAWNEQSRGRGAPAAPCEDLHSPPARPPSAFDVSCSFPKSSLHFHCPSVTKGRSKCSRDRCAARRGIVLVYVTDKDLPSGASTLLDTISFFRLRTSYKSYDMNIHSEEGVLALLSLSSDIFRFFDFAHGTASCCSRINVRRTRGSPVPDLLINLLAATFRGGPAFHGVSNSACFYDVETAMQRQTLFMSVPCVEVRSSS